MRAYIETEGNATKAATVAYNVRNKNSASSLGSTVLQRVHVREEVDRILRHRDLQPEVLAELHAKHLALIDDEEPQNKRTALKALDMAYRLRGSYAPTKSEHVSAGGVTIRADQVAVLRDVLLEKAGATAGVEGSGPAGEIEEMPGGETSEG